MSVFQVPIFSHAVSWEQALKIDINCFNWPKCDEVRPGSAVFLQVVPQEGLKVKLQTTDAPTTYCTEDNGAVWKDSCLEFFGSFDPSGQTYFNIEVNSFGKSFVQFGSADRSRRNFVEALGADCPAVITHTAGDGWSAEYTVSDIFIKRLFAASSDPFANGRVFTAGFYQCCEAAGQKHFAAAGKIACRAPDFHLPQYFLKLQLTDPNANRKKS